MAPERAAAWHARSPQDVLDALRSSPHGLTTADAAERLRRYGPNRLPGRPGPGPWQRLAQQFHQPLIYILLASGAIALLLGEWADAGVIFGVVLVNALIGFVQEGKAADALAALARSVASAVTVLRDGRMVACEAVELVPGDVVRLGAGDKVPADLRLFDARSLQIAEAALTGESVAVAKDTATVPADGVLAERACMAYAGTLVTAGQGCGVVVATGADTEVGRIAHLLDVTDALATPLTRAMAGFSRVLLWLILGLAVFGFVVGWMRGEALADMLMAAVALAVGAIPEGLPAAVTVTLAIGVARMARRKAIVRRLPAVETLGSTTVICSDKTGTLTENRMTVKVLWQGGRSFEWAENTPEPSAEPGCAGLPAGLNELLVAGVLCNDARLQADAAGGPASGDPTEVALLVAADVGGLDGAALRGACPRLGEIPFDAARPYMAVKVCVADHPVVFVKGALEALLPRCAAQIGVDGCPEALDPAAVEVAATALAADGLRVLAFARGGDGTLGAELPAQGLVFLGLQAMQDPPRPAAIRAVAACRAAGVTVKMITGDHAATALAVARQLGIAADGDAVLTGRELAGLDALALQAAAMRVNVFARVEPAQKLRLVQALQAGGEVVAMTGDGVNDAPALKAADIGVAMGAGGSEVAKEAAAMVLTDDNFATLEAAVEAGRGVFDNLVKFILWTLPTNFAEGLVILFAVLAGTTLPITPLQILWINMTTAVLLGMTLAFEPIEPDVMGRPPRPPGAPVLGAVQMRRVVLVGALLVAAAFGLFLRWRGFGASLEEARTIAVNVFVAGEVAYLFNCRSLRGGFWRGGVLANPWFWLGIGAMVALQAAFTWWPAMNRLFASAPPPPAAWLEIGAAAWALALAVGLEKRLTGGAASRPGAARIAR